MRLNLIGPFEVNAPFGTEIAFSKGLKRLGHEVIELDPNRVYWPSGIDMSADATVVFKSCLGQEYHLTGLRNVVVYQPDDARFPHIREMMLRMREYSGLFLSFDANGERVARLMGYRAAETLLLTADDELYCPSVEPVERDIDVSFIGSLSDPVAHASRRRMCEIVAEESRRRGWVFKYGTTQDMSVILDTYRRSKVVLNHATDVGQSFGYGYGLQCRHFEVAMTRTALLSNMLFDQERPSKLPFVQFDDERGLIAGIEVIHGNVEYFADGMYQTVMHSHRPEHRATQLIQFIERNA